MAFLTAAQRSFLQAVSQLGYANPFLPERVELERAVLDFQADQNLLADAKIGAQTKNALRTRAGG